MKLFLKILAGIVGVLVLAVAGVVTWATTMLDLNDYKADIEAQVEQATGRSFTIAGPIENEIGLDTRIKVTDITLGNADWGSRPEMVTIANFEVDLKPLSAVFGSPDIVKLHLTGVDALIETDDQGRQNTAMTPAGEASADEGAADTGETHGGGHGGGSGDIIIPILRDVRVADITVTLADAQTGESHQFVLDELTLSSNDPNEIVPLSLKAAFDAVPITMNGALGKPAAISGSEPWTIDINGDLAGLVLGIGGQIENAAAAEGIDIGVSVKSAEIGDLSPIVEQFAGQKVPALGPMDLGLKLAGDAGDGLAVQDFAFSLGTDALLKVDVVGGIADAMHAAGINLDVAVASPEIGLLSPIAKDFSGQGVPALGPMDLNLKVAGGLEDGVAVQDLAFTLGKAEMLTVLAEGGIADAINQAGIDIKLAVKSPEIGTLSAPVKEAVGQEVPALGPLDLSLAVNGGMASKLSMENLSLSLGTAKTLLVGASGRVDDLMKASGADLGVSVDSPDLSVLSKLAGSPVPPIGPVDVDATIKGDAGQPMTINPFTAKIADSDIGGSIVLDMTGATPNITARLSSEHFDTNDLTPPSEGGSSAGGSSSSASTGGASSDAGDGRIIPGDPLPLDGLKAVNADIEYKAKYLMAAVAELTDMDLKVKLQDGAVSIEPLDAKIGGGVLDGAIALDGSKETPSLNINIKGTKLDLASLLAGAGFKDKIKGPIDLNIGLAGAGQSPRAIAASLDGRSQISLYGSRILKKAFEEKVGSTVAGLLASEGGWIVIDCMVFDYPTKSGLMETKAGYVASGPITVVTSGEIDLNDESLDLNVKPKGGSIASVPLVVTGTLGSPSVIPDPVNIGVGILAGVLTGGIAPALLAVVGDLPEDHPCQASVKRSQEQAEQEPESSTGSSAVENPVKAIEEGVGGALKSIFGSD